MGLPDQPGGAAGADGEARSNGTAGDPAYLQSAPFQDYCVATQIPQLLENLTAQMMSAVVSDTLPIAEPGSLLLPPMQMASPITSVVSQLETRRDAVVNAVSATVSISAAGAPMISLSAATTNGTKVELGMQWCLPAPPSAASEVPTANAPVAPVPAPAVPTGKSNAAAAAAPTPAPAPVVNKTLDWGEWVQEELEELRSEVEQFAMQVLYLRTVLNPAQIDEAALQLFDAGGVESIKSRGALNSVGSDGQPAAQGGPSKWASDPRIPLLVSAVGWSLAAAFAKVPLLEIFLKALPSVFTAANITLASSAAAIDGSRRKVVVPAIGVGEGPFVLFPRPQKATTIVPPPELESMALDPGPTKGVLSSRPPSATIPGVSVSPASSTGAGSARESQKKALSDPEAVSTAARIVGPIRRRNPARPLSPLIERMVTFDHKLTTVLKLDHLYAGPFGLELPREGPYGRVLEADLRQKLAVLIQSDTTTHKSKWVVQHGPWAVGYRCGADSNAPTGSHDKQRQSPTGSAQVSGGGKDANLGANLPIQFYVDPSLKGTGVGAAVDPSKPAALDIPLRAANAVFGAAAQAGKGLASGSVGGTTKKVTAGSLNVAYAAKVKARLTKAAAAGNSTPQLAMLALLSRSHFLSSQELSAHPTPTGPGLDDPISPTLSGFAVLCCDLVLSSAVEGCILDLTSCAEYSAWSDIAVHLSCALTTLRDRMVLPSANKESSIVAAMILPKPTGGGSSAYNSLLRLEDHLVQERATLEARFPTWL
jgi:hypothetical protein